MALAPAAATFLDALRLHDLLKAAQFNELIRSSPATLSDLKTLARELIRRGWLTVYQVNKVLQGRGQELFLGPYLLLERLGEGGMGQIFKARHQRLRRTVALKLMRKDRLDSPNALRRFHNEIRAAAQLEHPNIVRAYDADEVGGTHFFTMEYVEGTDLARLLQERGRLPVALACDYVRQAALGLQHALERGLVHRDIKPANLLVTTAGVVKILDLGLARQCLDDEDPGGPLTRVGAVMGTIDYLAPEQARDSHAADIRSDLYSLGCTLYHLLTGQVPFPGKAPVDKLLKHQRHRPIPVDQLRPEVPTAVAAVVARLMAKQPEQRFQIPAHLAEALAGLTPCASAPVPAQAAGPEPPHTAAAGQTDTSPWASLLEPTVEDTAARPISGRPTAFSRRQWVFLAAGAVGLALATLALLQVSRL